MEKHHSIYSRFFDFIASRSDYLIPYHNRQASCEKWLQGEFIHFLYELKNDGTIVDADLEKSYGPRKGLCDIWFRTSEEEVWCELQVIVTNYNVPGKPITNQVNHVIEDAEKLSMCPSPNAEKLLVFLLYPMSKNRSNDAFWQNTHMNRIEAVAKIIREPYVIGYHEEFEARIYLAMPYQSHT